MKRATRTNGGTIHLQPVHPIKSLFLSITLLLGGCASRPADLITKQSSTHYWKWIVESKSWVYFDDTGKKVGAITKYEGLFFLYPKCHPTLLKDMSTTSAFTTNFGDSYFQSGELSYDTAAHAQTALEKTCAGTGAGK